MPHALLLILLHAFGRFDLGRFQHNPLKDINLTHIESRLKSFTRDGPSFHIDFQGCIEDRMQLQQIQYLYVVLLPSLLLLLLLLVLTVITWPPKTGRAWGSSLASVRRCYVRAAKKRVPPARVRVGFTYEGTVWCASCLQACVGGAC